MIPQVLFRYEVIKLAIDCKLLVPFDSVFILFVQVIIRLAQGAFSVDVKCVNRCVLNYSSFETF